MGGFVSKSSEETAATRSNEGAIVDNDGAIVRNLELKGSSKMIMSERDLDNYTHGFGNGILLSVLCFQGGALVLLAVAVQYSSYMGAKMNLEWSEMLIPTIQAKIRDRRSKGVPESDLLRELEEWEKERELAVVYMKKHKCIGKLVEMFHPKN